MTFKTLRAAYVAAGCPDKQGVSRPPAGQADEVRRLGLLEKAIGGDVELSQISLRTCAKYGQANQDRQRAADLDLQTLSNLMWFAVLEGHISVNPVLGRAKVRKSRDVVHCREAMPKDGDQLHAIARALLAAPGGAATGWQMLFEAFTGVRTSEALDFRVDAKARTEAGFVEGDFLYVVRQKSGGFPFVRLDPDLRSLIAAHRAWHSEHASTSPWYFPGRDLVNPLDRSVLTRALSNWCDKNGAPRITSHGLRAYFVTYHRSLGRNNEQVAALIGDRTASLIETTYGALPQVWAGGEPLSLMPRTGRPAWE